MLPQYLQLKIITGSILPQTSNTRKCSCVAKQAFRI